MSRRITASVVAVLATGTLAVAPVPADAAPVFSDAESALSSSSYVGLTGMCTSSGTTTSPNQTVPIVENGGAAKVTAAASGTISGDPGDSITTSASLSGSASVTSTGGLPRSIDVTVAGQVTATSQQPVSACSGSAVAVASAELEFTLSAPVYVRLEMTHTGPSSATFYLSGNSGALSSSASGPRSTRRLHGYLQAGTFSASYEEQVGLPTRVSVNAATSTTLHLEFWAPGAATEAPAGKALKYLVLPAAASCAGRSLDTVVTSRKKRAGKVKQVEYFLDDTKVKKVKHPKKGATVPVPIAAGAASELRVEVTLEPKSKGKKPKTVTSSASYEACP